MTLDYQGKDFLGECEFAVEFRRRSRSGFTKVLPDQVRNEIRARRYSICTEQEQKKLKKKLSVFAERRIQKKNEFFNTILTKW